jgi:hypothetical protein
MQCNTVDFPELDAPSSRRNSESASSDTELSANCRTGTLDVRERHNDVGNSLDKLWMDS